MDKPFSFRLKGFLFVISLSEHGLIISTNRRPVNRNGRFLELFTESLRLYGGNGRRLRFDNGAALRYTIHMMERDLAALPAAVQVTAHTHIAMLDAQFPDWLVGWYAVGSVALGAFDRRFSDLDFVAVVRRDLDDSEQQQLVRVHRKLADRRLFTALDGFYVPVGAFEDSAIECLRFNDGRFQDPVPFAPHSPDGWVLKHHGVPLRRPEPGGLPFEPDWARLRDGMVENLHTYWRNWMDGCQQLNDPRSLWLYASRTSLEWGVLGITRIYYSLREGDITSKTGAGEYALETMPSRWHPIIREAMGRRDRDIKKQFASPIKRRNEALAYMEHIFKECLKLQR